MMCLIHPLHFPFPPLPSLLFPPLPSPSSLATVCHLPFIFPFLPLLLPFFLLSHSSLSLFTSPLPSPFLLFNLCLSFVTVCLSLSVCLSVCQCVCLSVSLSGYPLPLSTLQAAILYCLSIVCLSVCLCNYFCLYICRFILKSPFVYLSIYLSIYIFI